MSAICGKFNRSGETVSAENLDSVMLEMAGYGRDGADTWQDGPVALGQQVTYITPESQLERLPYQDVQGGLVIAADARLDNREELFDVLGIDRVDRKVIGDSQLILQAYRHWAEDCPAHLLGDFAFAIWDTENRQLFCARDFMGVRPFYYYESSKRFYFASDIAALLAFNDLPCRLDRQYVRAQLEFHHFYHQESSFFENIRKLPAATSIIVRPEDLQRQVYWSPGQTGEIRYRKDEAYIEQLRYLIEQAIGSRLRTNYPAGSHISGGLDSSSITVLAARALRNENRTLHGFSWAPPITVRDYPLSDERAVVERVSLAENVHLHYTPFAALDLLADWTRDITRYPSETLRWESRASLIAAGEGVRVLLSGWGGDELPAFNGRGYFADLFLRGRWRHLSNELGLRAQLHSSSWRQGFRNKVVLPLVPDLLLAWARPNSQHVTQRMPTPKCLNPEFAKRLQQIPPFVWRETRERPGVRRNQIALLQDGHIVQRLESWSANGGRLGITYAYPLLDRRIVEFCLGIPDHLYFSNGWKRYIFRMAVTEILPKEAQWKKMKDDPAMTRAAILVFSEADRLLLSFLQQRRETINRTNYVDVDCLINDLSDTPVQGNVPSQRHMAALQALWLAFVYTDA